jgi:hypothetical protein
MTKAEPQRDFISCPSAEHGGAGNPKPGVRSFFFVLPLILLLLPMATMVPTGCTILATRPVQEMSDTAAALRAAKEVSADTLAPELYRQANEWFFKAKREYKFKNFDLAQTYSNKARLYAEDAEFEAIRNGGNRSDSPMSDPMAPGLNSPPGGAQPAPTNTPYEYPTPTGTPADANGGPPTQSTPPKP